MKNKFLYENAYRSNDYGWQVRDYFNGIYEYGRLETAIKKILHKEDYCLDVLQCRFPNDNSYDDYDHFEGVEFEMGCFDDDSEIRISENECLSFVKEAIFLYELKHPDRKGFADMDLKKTILGH